MQLEPLVEDLKEIRERGIGRVPPDKIPALIKVIADRRPDLGADARVHHLEDFLANAAKELGEHDEAGIRLAFGLDGLGRNSADRRMDFANHYKRTPRTVRRPGGLEDQAFTKLAQAILNPRPDAPQTLSPNDAVPRPPIPAGQIHPLTRQVAAETNLASLGTDAQVASGPVLTSRSRAYLAIDSVEQDLRQAVERFLLAHMPSSEVLGSAMDKIIYRQAALDDANHISPSAYLYPQEAYEILLEHADALPAGLTAVLQANLVVFESFVPVRNRVMRGRPLRAGDLETAEDFIERFRSEQFPQAELALVRLRSDSDWQPKPRAGSALPDLVLHNLPDADFDETGLLGRDDEVENIVRLLKRRREPISLLGEGGIGKTALAMEVCYRLIDDPAPPFEAVLWTSLKTERLTRAGVEGIADALRDIEGVTHTLGEAMDESFEGDLDELATLIGEKAILIVIDNLETVRGSEIVELYDRLPPSVTFLFTSRVGVGKLERPVHVGPLERSSAELLFRKLAGNSGVSDVTTLSSDDIDDVLARLRYSPLAIRWYIQSLEAGKSPDAVLRDQDELLRFCVSNVIEALSPTDRLLLDVLRVVDRPVSDDELAILSEMDIDALRRGAQHLTQRSLLVRSQGAGADESEVLSISSTARDFLPAVLKSDLIEEVMRREAAYTRDRETERRWIAEHGRYFDPNIIFERSPRDAPLAYLLHRALRENKTGQTEAAAATMDRARAIDRGYFEIDRIDAFFASTRRETPRATMLYRAALSNCDTEAERCWVGYFYSAHLARMAFDIPGAIKLAERTHAFYNTYDTAHHLGNFYVWDGRYEEGKDLIEWALEHAPTTEFSLKATTSLIECYRQWSRGDLMPHSPSTSLDLALRGAEIGIQRHGTGSTDERLVRSVIETTVEVLHAIDPQDLANDEGQRIASVLSRLNGDADFRAAASWRHLEYTVSSLPDTLRLRVAPGFSVDTAREGRFSGSIVWFDKTHRRYGFIAHPDFPGNVFFHAGSLLLPTRMDDLAIGASVDFTPTKNSRGQDEAVAVILAAGRT